MCSITACRPMLSVDGRHRTTTDNVLRHRAVSERALTVLLLFVCMSGVNSRGSAYIWFVFIRLQSITGLWYRPCIATDLCDKRWTSGSKTVGDEGWPYSAVSHRRYMCTTHAMFRLLLGHYVRTGTCVFRLLTLTGAVCFRRAHLIALLGELCWPRHRHTSSTKL